MSRRELLALVALSGYVIAFVPVFWARHDVARIPRSVWRYGGIHPRSTWRAALLFGYVCAGWPGLVVAVVWFLSGDRSSLREEWAHLHQRNVESRERRVAPHDEPEIVLADHEDEPAPVSHQDAPHQDAPHEDASPPG